MSSVFLWHVIAIRQHFYDLMALAFFVMHSNFYKIAVSQTCTWSYIYSSPKQLVPLMRGKLREFRNHSMLLLCFKLSKYSRQVRCACICLFTKHMICLLIYGTPYMTWHHQKFCFIDMLHYVTFSWLFTCPKMNIICRSDLNLGLMSETFNPSHRKGLITVSSPILIIIIQHLCIDTTWSSFLYEPFLVSLRCLIDPKSVQFIVAQPGTRSIGAGILR